MAKKKTEETQTVTPSALDMVLKELIGQHNAVSAGAAVLGSEMNSEIKQFIDSGSLTLNMILSNRPDGGWPCGRIVEVFGRESTGKSTLGYVALGNCQKMGGIAIYADIEHTGNPDFMRMLGVDLDTLITTDIPEIEKLFLALERNLTVIANSKILKDKPTMIVVDSVTALLTDAESEGDYEYNMNVAMGKAKQLGKALRKLVPYLTKANACLYFVNQVRQNTSGYGEPWVVPGGMAIPFFSSIRVHLEGRVKIVVKDQTLELAYQDALAEWKMAGGKKSGIEKPEKPKDNKENETIIGYEVSAYTKKNKTAPADRRASFRIIFSQGLFDEECWLQTCIKYGIVKQVGSKHTLLGDLGVEAGWGEFTKAQWLKKLESDEDIYWKIRTSIIDKMTIPLQFDKSKYSIEDENIEGSEDDYTVTSAKAEEAQAATEAVETEEPETETV